MKIEEKRRQKKVSERKDQKKKNTEKHKQVQKMKMKETEHCYELTLRRRLPQR